MQRCTLEKKTVKKIHPDTACRKIPREVCVPNNCAMVQGDEICRDENRMLVQNVPQEECELQPEENCHMEAVLVPRSVTDDDERGSGSEFASSLRSSVVDPTLDAPEINQTFEGNSEAECRGVIE